MNHASSHRVGGAPNLPNLSRRELSLLTLGVVVSLLIHARFCFAGFGEQDAARLAVDAIHWHAERVIYMAEVDYRLRTSPLYIHLLKLALDHGVAIRLLPRLMNGASVVFSSGCLVGLYLLFRRFSGAPIAAAATVVYGLTPCFWLGSVYGMPTVPALTFWVFAALAFARAADERELREPRAMFYLGLAALLAAVAFSLKADLVLSAGALLAILLLDQRLRLPFLGAAVGVVVFGFVVALLYSSHLAAPVAASSEGTNNLGGFLQNWNSRFPFRWQFLIDPKNNICITHAVGSLLFAVIVIALVHGALSGGRRARFTLGAAAWGVPAILFWGLKAGNSARHNLPAFPVLVLLAVEFLFSLSDYKAKKAWALIALLTGIGLLDESGGNSVAPKTDLLASSAQVEGSSRSLHDRARTFMNSPGDKKAIIESSYLIAYTEFEVWAAAKSPVFRAKPRSVLDPPDRETRIYQTGGVRAARAIAQDLRKDGWDVFSVQFQL